MLSLKQPNTATGIGMPFPAMAQSKTSAVSVPPPQALPPLPEEANGFRRLAFYFCLACIFIRFSFISEALASGIGVNTYMLYFTAPVAIVGTLATGGLARTFRSKAAVFLMLFFACMVVATVFSSWRGGSLPVVKAYAQTSIFLLFAVAGLVLNWHEIRLVFHTMAFSGLAVLVISKLFLRADQGRFSLSFGGTIANSNDLATHVLLMIPFMLFVLMDKRAMYIMRLLYFAAIPYSLYVVLGTASRGCLVALVAGCLFWFFKASMRQKMLAFLLLPVLIAPAIALLPQETFNRLSTLSGEKNQEADESADSRRYLFWKGVEFSIKHPLLGVGPEQFMNVEGASAVAAGGRGNWHQTHCTWVQISSECGIPAMIFFIAALGGAYVLVNRCYKQAQKLKLEEIASACFCYMLACVFFYVSTSFLSNGYTFRQPFLVGLAIAMFFAMQRTVMAMQVAKVPA
ncbi:O-antigen ligase family protein [Bryobacter aggregatus]|uniref:O-antigen ligase family protein n=1 Tax=Bryobacter aggregatus TaxID=360054 RepID=UPI00138E3A1C|nr:O-antigen ligase family protein [Bryobacter aggregatus]